MLLFLYSIGSSVISKYAVFLSCKQNVFFFNEHIPGRSTFDRKNIKLYFCMKKSTVHTPNFNLNNSIKPINGNYRFQKKHQNLRKSLI